MISVYRPWWNNKYNSTYFQHLSYSVKKREGFCPRELFLKDLQEEILRWKEMGDSVIVLGDFNEDI